MIGAERKHNFRVQPTPRAGAADGECYVDRR
jgi:hypothetical protein